MVTKTSPTEWLASAPDADRQGTRQIGVQQWIVESRHATELRRELVQRFAEEHVAGIRLEPRREKPCRREDDIVSGGTRGVRQRHERIHVPELRVRAEDAPHGRSNGRVERTVQAQQLGSRTFPFAVDLLDRGRVERLLREC
jgi:hypothetical protein